MSRKKGSKRKTTKKEAFFVPTMVSISGRPCIVVFGNDKKKLKHLTQSIDALNYSSSPFDTFPFPFFTGDEQLSKNKKKKKSKCKKKPKKKSIRRSQLSKKEIRKLKKLIKKSYKSSLRDAKKGKKSKKVKKQKISNKAIKKISKQVLRHMRAQMFDQMVYHNTGKVVSHYLSKGSDKVPLVIKHEPDQYSFNADESLLTTVVPVDEGRRVEAPKSPYESGRAYEESVESSENAVYPRSLEHLNTLSESVTKPAPARNRKSRKKTSPRRINRAKGAAAHNMYPQKIYKRKPELDANRITKIHAMHKKAARSDSKRDAAKRKHSSMMQVQNAPFPQASKNERRVLEYLSTHPQATQSELSNVLLVSRSTIADYTSSLQLKGYLRREGTRRDGRWVVVGLEA